MNLNTIDLMLTSKLQQRGETLMDKQFITVREVIAEYALYAIDRYRSNEGKFLKIEAIKLLPSLIKRDYKMFFRKLFYNRAVRHAKNRAYTENLKFYVIRTSDVAYTVLSTRDVELNKKLKIFGKQVDAKLLHEMSDYVATPRQ